MASVAFSRVITHNVTMLVTSIVVMLSVACSQVTRVPPAEYGSPRKAAAYRIRTVDGALYTVSEYVATDSTLVIRAFHESQKKATDTPPPLPFEIPLSQVSSVDSVAMDRGRASLWVFGAGAVILVILFLSGMSVNLS